MTVKELKAQAKELGITGYSKMKKDDLEKAIKKAKANVSTPKVETNVPKPKHTAPVNHCTPHTTMNVDEFGLYLGNLSKGEARKARKAAFAAGFRAHAATRRVVESSQKIAA